MASEQLIAIYSQHTVYLNRLAAGLGNDVIPYLDDIYTGINSVFARYSSRKRITPELETKIRSEISAVVSAELQEYTRYLKSQQREVGIYESEFSSNELEQAVKSDDFESDVPTAAQITAAAVSTPIKLSEDNYITYNSMMRNYWQKWTDDIDAVVAQGFIQGQTIAEIQGVVLDTIQPSKTGSTKSTLDRARRQAKSISITGTNHYANQARLEFSKQNLDVIKGYEFVSVLDSRTSQQCRSLDGRKFKKDDPKLSQFTPPLHPNCRSTMVYDVDERFTIADEDTNRASRFRVDGKLDPKQVNSNKTYYEVMKGLSASDQNAILGPTLGKAFRKLDNPTEFAKLTIDSLGNPLTLTEIRKRDNALSRILNNKPQGG